MNISQTLQQEAPVCTGTDFCSTPSLSQNDSQSNLATDVVQQSDRAVELSDSAAQAGRALLSDGAAQVSDQVLPSDRAAQPGSNLMTAPSQLKSESEAVRSLKTALDSHLSVLMVLDPNFHL